MTSTPPELEINRTMSDSPSRRKRASVTLTPVWADKMVLEISGTSAADNNDEDADAAAIEKTPVAFFPAPPSMDALRSQSMKLETEVGIKLAARPAMPGPKSIMYGSFRSPKKSPASRKEEKIDLTKVGAQTMPTDTTTTTTQPQQQEEGEKKLETKKEKDQDDDEEDDDDEGAEEDDYFDDGGSSINSEDMKDLATEIWEDVPEAPADAILGIAQAYKVCDNPKKVNVCVGAYRDENGKPWVLPSVRQAEHILWEQHDTKEYLPIEGDREFVELAMRFAYGDDIPMEHLAAVQTLSGTGACRVGGSFLNRFWPKHPIYVPTPTWGNHVSIFRECGLTVRKYRYYNRATNALDFQGMIRDIHRAPKGSIILLHACAHNPTGCDPTIEQWRKIISVISHKEHIAFFDSAYQGFASGDAEQDAQPFRYAVAHHVPIVLAQSFAKNFGLYGERCGTLSVVCGDIHQKEHILSELRTIIRPMYSSPPCHGSSIVKTILKDTGTLKPQYYQECTHMSKRIQLMRTRLVQALQKAGSTHDWNHILQQIGMFAFTGLNQQMCKQLTDEYAIFLTTNGRISVAGLNEFNVDYVAQAIHAVSDGKSILAES